MRVYLSSDHHEQIEKSGVGRALDHQKLALEAANIPYTLSGDGDYQIIHLNTIFPKSYLKAKKAKKQGKAVIYHAHSTAEDFQNSFLFSNALSNLFKKWLIKCYQTADLILTPSEYSKSLLKAYSLTPPIEVISNGIDLDYWTATAEEVSALQKHLKLDPERPIIISVGLQIKRKGILDFVALSKMIPEAQFVWFGYTDPKILDRETRTALETRRENLIFAGYVERDVLRVAYQMCDLYLFPTYEETEGIVLLEALASKAPVIVRDIPVFAEYEHGTHLYKAKDLDDFLRHILSLLNWQLRDLTKNGYRKVQEKSIPVIGEKLRGYYEQAITLAKIDS